VSRPLELVFLAGAAADLHDGSAALMAGDVGAGQMRVLSADRPAVVLGSTQPATHVDAGAAAAAGVEVARRRSGGGAVLVGPGRCLWVDIAIARDDGRFDDDVGRAAWWVGEAWVAALRRIGVGGAEVWRGALLRRRWADRICFAGVGAGEVTVAGRKVVGVSQRRTRAGALFQCAALLDGDPTELLGVLVLDGAERRAAARSLTATTRGLGPEAAHPLLEGLASALAPGARSGALE